MDAKPTTQLETPSLVIVTGPSGAGRSTAINAFEDLGYETIDNLPLSLLPRLLDGPEASAPIALGVDVRNRDFSANALIEVIDTLSASPDVTLSVLYLDCADDVLVRRYSETRRRHPLSPEGAPGEGIAREIDLLAPIRARADALIDTSEMTPHDLRAEVSGQYALSAGHSMSVQVQSFSYKRGVPRGVDMVLDCRFLKNPHWEPDLRGLDGRDVAVAAYVQSDAAFKSFFDRVNELVITLLPSYVAEGKTHFAIGFGCTGGQHRSVATAEMLANTLAEAGWQVSKRHRELERRMGATTPSVATRGSRA